MSNMSNINKILVGSTTYDITPSSDGTFEGTSDDVADGSATSWTTVATLTTGETNGSIFTKISNMFKNIRYLYSRLGTTDISGIGNSITEAISALNNNKAPNSTFTSAAAGLVPAAKSGSTSYLTSGYVLTGAGWKAGDKYNTDTDTTYAVMGAATSAAAGTAGLVPAPAAGKQTSFLRGDKTWVIPTNTTYAVFTTATASANGTSGLVPAPTTFSYGKTLYLNSNGSWTTPTDTDTTYATFTTASASVDGTSGLVPAPTTFSYGKTLYLNSNGSWTTPTNTTYALNTSGVKATYSSGTLTLNPLSVRV